jgi:hypothetical protein
VSKTIPEMTILAWRDKRDELVYTISDQELERTFGVKYRKPGILARFIMVVFKVLPKVGPLKPLAFEPLTSDAERLFAASVRAAHARYREVLLQVTRGRIDLADADLDTGHRPARGRNPLADETYTELLQRHARLQFASMPASLRDAINAYYGNPVPQPRDAQEFRKQQTKAAKLLAALNSPSARR